MKLQILKWEDKSKSPLAQVLYEREHVGVFVYACGSCTTILAIPLLPGQMKRFSELQYIEDIRGALEDEFGAETLEAIDKIVRDHFVDHYNNSDNAVAVIHRS